MRKKLIVCVMCRIVIIKDRNCCFDYLQLWFTLKFPISLTLTTKSESEYYDQRPELIKSKFVSILFEQIYGKPAVTISEICCTNTERCQHPCVNVTLTLRPHWLRVRRVMAAAPIC